ncbi:conserved hypothetical protein [Trichinella spiralis]|uniref:hypothetical protein n=1 Tax=Trichinella spiralis TaxID=6334 RepID=UPI0001EFD7F0|nr:conserved hypothetical protein [Trichinella spiralis]
MQLRLSPLKSDHHERANQFIEALTLTKICDNVPSKNRMRIHILIGLDFYGQFVGEKILRGGHNDLAAIETTLGWVVFGPMNPHCQLQNAKSIASRLKTKPNGH